MKTKILIAVLLLGIAFLLVRYPARHDTGTLEDMQPEIGLTFPEAQAFQVRKNILRQGVQGTSRSIEAVRGSRLLKIEVTTGLSPEQAGTAMNERLFMVRSLYTNIPSPYPGMVTNTISSQNILPPRTEEIDINGVSLPLYIIASNARYTYGAMNRETVAFMSGLCILYNMSTQTLYRLDLFIPKDDFQPEALIAFFAGIRPRQGRLQGPDAGMPIQKSAGPAPGSVPQAQSDRLPDTLNLSGCNLILIALEPLGANHMRSYGYKRETTPHLDAFAKESFLFTRAKSASSWSLPAFMSWFTSQYPSRHRVTNKYSIYTEENQVLANLADLSPGVTTLTRVLRENGYHTAGFTGDASLAGEYGFALGFDEYYDGKRFGGFDLTIPMSLDWLAHHKNDRFFLFVQGYDVHGRFSLEEKYLPQFLDRAYSGPLQGSEDEYWELRNKNIEQGGISVGPDDMNFLRAVYDAKIFAADRRLGAFFKSLDELGLLENSIVIFSSGSGNEYNEHGRIDHGFSLYEELIHVPLMIRIPGQHGLITDQVRTIDIMPTVIDLLGLSIKNEVRDQMQGTSLLPLLAGGHLDLDATAETDYLLKSFKRSISTNDGWKLIVSLDTEKRELYNLNTDPGEQNNLIESEGRLAYELEQKLFRELAGGSSQ